MNYRSVGRCQNGTSGCAQRVTFQERQNVRTRVGAAVVVLFAIVFMALTTLSASADVLYTNGPVSGYLDAGGIYGRFSEADFFDVSANSIVTGFDFGAWYWPNDLPYTVEWSITSSPAGGTVFGNGTAYLSNTFLFFNPNGFPVGLNIGNETVSGLDVALTPGRYWLTLSNGSTLDELPLYWDVEGLGIDCPHINCPLDAYEFPEGTPILAESFTIYGTNAASSAPVPEPRSLLLLGSGIIGLACVFRGDRINGLVKMTRGLCR